MKILITGGSGFIGSNLVNCIFSNKNEHEIIILDDLSTGKNEYLEEFSVEFHKIDIAMDYEGLVSSFGGVDTVIHLAARGSVIDSIRDPKDNFNTNVTGTFNVVRAAAQTGVKKIVFASTGGAIMGNTPPPVNESSLPKPISPYGASKLCGEAYLSAFANSYGFSAIALRFANIYGKNSIHKKGVITTFMKSAINERPLDIYGDGEATRDYLHVDDLCRGILAAVKLESANDFDVYHLASGIETSVNEMKDLILRISNKSGLSVNYHSKRVGEVQKNFASGEKAKQILNFEPKISINDGLRDLWEWTKKVYKRE